MGIVAEVEVSRMLAAQAHMDWVTRQVAEFAIVSRFVPAVVPNAV